MKNLFVRPLAAAALCACFLFILLVSGCRKEETVSASEEIPADLDAYHSEIDRQIAQEGLNAFGTGLIMMDAAEYDRLPMVAASALPQLAMDPSATDRGSQFILPTPSVRNQGNEGSCVAFAAGYAGVSYYLKAIRGWSYSTSSALRSPEFLYNTTKLSGNCNAGTNIPQALNFLMNYGVCSWSDMPYTDYSCTQWPNNTQWQRATSSRISGWNQVSRDPAGMRSLLERGYPIIVGVQLDDSFYGQTTSYPYTWKSSYGSNRGGHAVLIVGYDSSRQAFIVQNSWGSSKHDNGYFYLSYNLVSQMSSSKLQLFTMSGLR